MTKSPALRVIFVEDDHALRAATRQSLELEGLAVEAHERAATALRSVTPEFDGVVVSDIRLPGMDGLEFFAALRDIDPEVPVIFTTGHGDVAMAVGAMKQGAADFLTKPYSPRALVESIRRAAEKRALVLENRRLRAALSDRQSTGLVGDSPRARQLEVLVGEVARTEIDIVLTGPDGAGKTFLARRIHDLGPRRTRPFVSIDAGIWTHPEAELIVFGRDPSERLSRSGLIERAQGGSLLLDNVEAIPEALHGRIASLLENRSYLALGADRARNADVRIIAIAPEDAGRATDALVRRLGGITITLPSLAERRDDIPAIFRYFVAGFEAETRTTARPLREEDWRHLLASDWPGNVRELRDHARNFVLGLTGNQAAATGEPGAQTLAAMVASFERSLLVDALANCAGRTALVEQQLGIERRTLYDKLARHGLRPGDFRKAPASSGTDRT